MVPGGYEGHNWVQHFYISLMGKIFETFFKKPLIPKNSNSTTRKKIQIYLQGDNPESSS
jgi:hypothetical protein